MADSLLPQPGIHGSDGQFDRDSHVIPDDGRGGPGSPPQAIDGYHIRTSTDDPAGNGSYIVDRGDLYSYGFGISGCLFQGEDELTKILYGIDVVMRGRG